MVSSCGLALTLCLYPNVLLAVQEMTDTLREGCAIRMDQTSVIKIAKRTAVAKVENLDHYHMEKVSFEFTSSSWTVFFIEKEPAYSFDGCFRVEVDDKTGKSEFRACP